MYAGVLKHPSAVRRLDERMARLEKLFASPRYRVKYVVVLESRWFRGRHGLYGFLERMEFRYPLVAAATEDHSWIPQGLGRQWVFYVGGESFERERKQLVQLTADLRSRWCGDATELGRESAALRRRWRDFEKSATSRERSSAEYESLSEEMRDVLAWAEAGDDCAAETTPRR